MSLPDNKARALVWCAVAYVAAIAAGWVALRYAPTAHPFWQVAFADVVGTLVIFGFSRAFNNSSFYDAYWSVGPICFALVWTLAHDTVPLRAWLVTGLITAWGVRLTYNWARHWKGLRHEDWRYVDLRDQTGALYWVVSLLGLHMFPTVVVLACSTGMWVALSSSAPLGPLDIAAAVVTGGGILIEMIADKQLHLFVASNTDPKRIMASGLWSWSRHPNYFGEMSFWWGLFLFSIAASPDTIWPIAGPIALTAMFMFISIPMIEKRMLKKRPHYEAHQERVSMLIPLPPSG